MLVLKVLSSSLGRDVGYPVDRHLVGGVVDEDVYPAELVDGLLDELPGNGLSSPISPGTLTALRPESSTARAVSLASGSSSFEVGDHDVGALAGEGERDGPADARVPAGDDAPSCPRACRCRGRSRHRSRARGPSPARGQGAGPSGSAPGTPAADTAESDPASYAGLPSFGPSSLDARSDAFTLSLCANGGDHTLRASCGVRLRGAPITRWVGGDAWPCASLADV